MVVGPVCLQRLDRLALLCIRRRCCGSCCGCGCCWGCGWGCGCCLGPEARLARLPLLPRWREGGEGAAEGRRPPYGPAGGGGAEPSSSSPPVEGRLVRLLRRANLGRVLGESEGRAAARDGAAAAQCREEEEGIGGAEVPPGRLFLLLRAPTLRPVSARIPPAAARESAVTDAEASAKSKGAVPAVVAVRPLLTLIPQQLSDEPHRTGRHSTTRAGGM